MEKVVLTTGGTGGHIYPALSIAKKMREQNIETLFIGTKHRMEKEIIPKEGFRFEGLDIIPLKSVIGIVKIIFSTFKALKILRKEKPDKVIGFGNYITIPVLIASKILRIPYYLQEQNSIMGLANKYFYKGARKVFLAFGNTLDSIPNKYREKFIVTGNPIREEFYHKNKSEERKKLDIKKEDRVILVIGGSLGAKKINETLLEVLEDIKKDNNLKLFWATGKENYEETISKIESNENIVVMPYFENVADYMSAADLVICRAGASTISELIQLEKPAILIPYDYVGQKENADVLEYINGAKTFSNEDAKKGIKEALSLIKHDEMLNFMKNNIKKIKISNATKLIIETMDKDSSR